MQLSVHSFIRPFLQGSEFDGDAKTLADFISLMLKNNKSQDQIVHELSEIVGLDVAQELTDQMFKWIEENSIDVRVEMGSTRILGAALKQATAEQVVSLKRDRDEEMQEMQEPKKALKITDRLGPSLSERLGKKESLENGKSGEKSHTKQKCSFWPDCKKSDCPFVHPTSMCQYGDSCTKGAQCTYIHMSDLKGKKEESANGTKSASDPMHSTMIPCKFGQGCLKPDCPFGHPSAPTVALNQQSSLKSTIACRFDPGCLNPLCPYSHPSQTSAQINAMSPIGANFSPTVPSNIQCKYDPFCTRVGCLFKHSPKDITLPPSKKFLAESYMDNMDSPTIITSPHVQMEHATFSNGRPGRFKNKSLILNATTQPTVHISQRGYAVSDAETEKFKMNTE